MKKETKKTTKKELPTRPKGTRDIENDQYYLYQGFFEKAQEIAIYYGFSPVETPMMEDSAIYTSSIGAGTDIIEKEMYKIKSKSKDDLALRPELTAGIVRAYIENGWQSLPQPVMKYHSGPVFRHDKPQRGRYRQFWQFDVDALGSDKSIIDALIIKVLMTILEECGSKNLVVDINSVGDKISRPAYTKELVTFYKKHLSDLPAIDRERLKTNPMRILDSKEPKTVEINQLAPDPVSFLTPEAKKHLKEVLEYLEEMGIPYRMNKCLVRGLSYYTHTVFEIQEEAKEEGGTPLTLAAGGRYDYLARELGNKKDIFSVGGSIGVDRILEQEWYKKPLPRILKKPKVYFVQLGMDAKLKSLNVIEILRKAHIPIQQSLSKDSLGSQLGVAEKLGIPYTIIFGQKESIDGTVIVKDMKKFSQETVKLDDLAEYIKNL